MCTYIWCGWSICTAPISLYPYTRTLYTHHLNVTQPLQYSIIYSIDCVPTNHTQMRHRHVTVAVDPPHQKSHIQLSMVRIIHTLHSHSAPASYIICIQIGQKPFGDDRQLNFPLNWPMNSTHTSHTHVDRGNYTCTNKRHIYMICVLCDDIYKSPLECDRGCIRVCDV